MRKILQVFLIIIIINLAMPVIADIEDDFTRGLDLYNKKNYQAALAVFQNVISQFESMADTGTDRYAISRYYRGKCLAGTGKLYEAINDFLFVETRGMKEYPVWREIIGIYVSVGNPGRAITYLEKKIESDRQYDYFVELGRLYWVDGKSQKALEAYENARALKSGDPKLLFYMANLLWESGESKKAGMISSELEKASEDPVMREFARGLLLNSIGLYEDSIPHLKKVVDADPKNLTAKLVLADSYLKSGDAPKAEEITYELIQANRREPFYWYKSAEIALSNRDVDFAKKLYDQMDNPTREHPFAVCLKAYILVNDRMADEARRILAKYRQGEIGNSDYYSILSAAEWINNNPDGIMDLLDRYSENIGGDFPIQDSLFWLISFGEPKTIFDELSKFAEKLGSSKPALDASWALAQYFVYTHDLKSALEWIDKSIELDPKAIDYPYDGAIISLRLKDKDKAKKYWEKVMANPEKCQDWKYIEVEMKDLLK